MTAQPQIKKVLRHLRVKLGHNAISGFKTMNLIRTNPDWEDQIKHRIAWVHAQTARGSYKKKGEEASDNSDDEEAGDKKPKAKKQKTKPKPKGFKREFLPESLTNVYDNQVLRPDSDWYHYFNSLQNFHQKHGHFDVPRTTNTLLYDWIKAQRASFKDKTLKDNRKYLFDQIKFPIDESQVIQAIQSQKPDGEWFQYYNELRKFYTTNGHCHVPLKGHHFLYQWTVDQKQHFHENKLTDNRKYLLHQLNFPFGSTITVSYDKQDLNSNSQWYNYYKELSSYHAKHGHCRVFPEENELLHQWLMEQRKAFASGEMPSNRKYLLEQVNFSFPAKVNSGVSSKGAVASDD